MHQNVAKPVGQIHHRFRRATSRLLLEQIPEWKIVDVNGVKHLKRVIKVKGWRPAVDLTNQIAALADETDHHPAILTEWGKVTVEWWTHAIKGLHRNDFIMAAKVDGLLSSD